MSVRVLASLAMTVVCASTNVLAQTTPDAPPSPVANTQPAASEESDDNVWSVSVSAYTYIVPDSGNYVQPTFTADRGWLHLEARYNYEALDTGSAWVGYNFSGGENLAWEFTPMLAGVFGKITGVAPGYKASLSWWKLGLYSEGEHVFETGDSANSFTYTWSELTLAPVEWFRFGLATQRTHVHQSDGESQGGPFVGFNYKKVDLSAYVFNPDADEPTFVIAVGLRY
jgi:hypothetical protein